MVKQIMRLSILLLAALSFSLTNPIKSNAEEDFSVSASAAFAVDCDSGKIFYNQNGDEPLAIASMTKLITAYIVLDEIKNGNLSWEQTVPISDNLKEMSQNPDLSNIPLDDTQTFTVKDALYGSLISSANSLTSALAELISGSEVKFVDRMYDQLKVWGIEDATLVSASGLGNEDIGTEELYPGTTVTDENMLSAKDMAIVSRQLIQDFPEVLNITTQPNATILEGTEQETVIENSDKMLKGFDYYKEGVDGLKTGTTDLAGDCFTGTITKDGHRIITVVMNVNPDSNRFEETAKLMDYVLDSWTLTNVAKKGNLADKKEVTVKNGQQKSADLILADSLSLWTNDSSSIVHEFIPNNEVLNADQEISAPMKQGDEIGQEKIVDEKDTLGYLDDNEDNNDSVNVVLKDSVKKENFFMQLWHSIIQLFS